MNSCILNDIFVSYYKLFSNCLMFLTYSPFLIVNPISLLFLSITAFFNTCLFQSTFATSLPVPQVDFLAVMHSHDRE